MYQWRVVNGTGHYVGSRRNMLTSCGVLVGATSRVWNIVSDVGTIPLCEHCKAKVMRTVTRKKRLRLASKRH